MARFNFAMLLLLVVIGIPYYWFLLDNSSPPAQPQPVGIAQLRSLAAPPGEALPTRIRYERIASQSLMGNRIAAGMGLRPVRLHTLSFMVEYARNAPVLIGAGMARADVERFGHEAFAPKAQARVEKALGRARGLVPLSSAPEQLGGLRTIGGERARTLKADLARQQQADRQLAPHRVAPGVVVIPTPQFQPGSRMVFARQADGREYLFAGGLARVGRNWVRLRLPARFVTDLGRREDRQAMRSWLVTVQTLKRQAPALVIVPGSGIPRHSGLQRFFDDSGNILQ